jgi:hypothetical protein
MGYWRLHVVYGYDAEFARSRNGFIVVAERIGRYANTIHRQLLQALNELERLQRRRGGEAVPAPINIDVNLNGLEEELTDGPQASWDLSCVGSLSTLVPGRLIGTGSLQLPAMTKLLRSRATQRYSFSKRTQCWIKPAQGTDRRFTISAERQSQSPAYRSADRC